MESSICLFLKNKKMKKYRGLIILLIACLFFVSSSLQDLQKCTSGGSSVDGIYSGIMNFPFDGLNEGTVNKNYFQQIEAGSIDKNSRTSIAFSLTSFQGSGRQNYYSLMIKLFQLENENTRLRLMLDFQYPKSNMLSIWTHITISYLIVTENMEKNGFSYIWTYIKEIQLNQTFGGGIVDGELFNHKNDKQRCGFDGKNWHTDGCKNKEATALYHVYVSGFKFNPYENDGIFQLAFSLEMLGKDGEFSNDESAEKLDVIFDSSVGAGPILKIDSFSKQLQKIKVSIVMSVAQIHYAKYPLGTFSTTYSGLYFKSKQASNGLKVLQKSLDSNIYKYPLPGMRYYIYGITKFVVTKGLPRQTSVSFHVQVMKQDAIFFQQTFRNFKNEIIFSGDFYYKKIDSLCSALESTNYLQKTNIDSIKFSNFPSNETTYVIKTIDVGDMTESENEFAIEYLYYPNEVIEQTSTVSYMFTQIEFGGAYLFYFSINEVGKDGVADFTGYHFIVYANGQEIYRDTLVGTSDNDKIQSIKKGINIYKSTLQLKIVFKLTRQPQKNLTLRFNFLITKLSSLFNPLTQCCTAKCPPNSGLNLTSIPVSCITCNQTQGFYYDYSFKGCYCMKGYYYLAETVFPKCMKCQAALCDKCETGQPTRCIECGLGAGLDLWERSCKCYEEFQQEGNKCMLVGRFEVVCAKYGYCDKAMFVGLTKNVSYLLICPDGYFENGQGSCSKCNPTCLTCKNINSCLTCDQLDHRILSNNICTCRQGYFLMQFQNSTRKCIKCAPQCHSCEYNSESCTQCDEDKFMVKTLTGKGFFTCSCMPGYHNDGKGNCVQSNCNADRFCATCEDKICTSCIKSFKRVLKLPEHVCECAKGYFENQQGECQSCSDGCAQCKNGTSCLTCVISARIKSDGTCQCPLGTFYKFLEQSDIGYCKQCPKSCDRCIDQKSCVSCSPTYSLSPDLKCICPPSHLQKNNSVCQPCQQGCSDCTNATECLKCKQSYLLQERVCVRNCRMGFFRTEKQCFKCGQGCGNCEDSVSCVTCQAGYILYQSQCYKDCPQGSIRIANESKCIPCNPPCKTCMYHPSHCVSCQAGKGFLQQVGDQQKCLLQCPVGTYPLNGACQLCDLNCLSCLGDKSNCIECPQKQFLFKGRCHSTCPGVLFGDQCINFCPNGYFKFMDDKCMKCSESCMTCEKSEDNCLSCFKGFFLKNNQCIEACDEGQFKSYQGKCLNCSTNCRTCSSNAFDCTSCNQGFSLMNNKCERQCQEDQYFSTTNLKCQNCPKQCTKCQNETLCLSCQQSYTLKNGKCVEKCQYPCETCKDTNKCLSCKTGFFLIQKQYQCTAFCPKGMRAQNNLCKCAFGFYYNGLCVQTCPNQMYANLQSKSCEICQMQNCLKCNNNSHCLECKDGFKLSDDKSQCIAEGLKQIMCPYGFQLQKGSCQRICNQNNFHLSSSSYGLLCKYGQTQMKETIKGTNYFIDTQIVRRKCSESQYQQQGQCKSVCDLGYYPEESQKICKKCPSSCLICENEGKCQICNEGFYFVNEICVKNSCEKGKYFFNGKCLKNCPMGAFFNGQICEQLCLQHHFYLAGFCYQTCPSEYSLIADLACVRSCPEKYIQKGNLCMNSI